MWLAFDDSAPRWRQLYVALRDQVLTGTLAPGHRLPSSRQQAELLGVSRNTVLTAYDQLLAEGYLEARSGSGTYVARALIRAERSRRDGARAGETAPGAAAGDAVPPATAQVNARPTTSAFARRAVASGAGRQAVREPIPYDFRYGLASHDESLLLRWRRLLANPRTAVPLDYGDPRGLPSLREALAGYLRRRRGVVCDAASILITTGSQQGLDLASRVLLDPGDSVLLEEPHYQGARQAFEAHGARLLPAPIDDDGLTLPSPRRRQRPRLVYTTPSHQFPTGAVMPLARRLALLAYLDAVGAIAIEDDYDSEFRYDAEPLPSLQGLDRSGRVVYLGTFSKVLFPGLRLGYAVVPPTLREPFTAAKWLADRQTAALAQAAMARLIDEGHFERRLRRERIRQAGRRACLLAALEDELGADAVVAGAAAGVHVLVRLPRVPAGRMPALVAEARDEGVGVYPATPYYLTPPPTAELVLGYAALEPERIRAGVERLARVVRRLADRAGPTIA